MSTIGRLRGFRKRDGPEGRGRLQIRTISQRLDKLFGRYVGLTQYSRKCPDFDFTVHWHYTSLGPTAHDDVASILADVDETKALKSFYDRCARYPWQFRHVPAE